MASALQMLRTISSVAVATIVWLCRQKPVFKRKKEVWFEDLYFAESPRWHKGALYFSDFGSDEVIVADFQTRQRRTVTKVPDAEDNCRGPSGLGWMPDGTLLVSEQRKRRLLAFAAGEEGAGPTRAVELADMTAGFCNDIVVDSKGGAYVGNNGFDLSKVEGMPPWEWGETIQPTSLVRVDEAGRAAAATPPELAFPNGAVITPDGQTLLVAETFGGRISAYKRAPDGSLSERSTWASIPWSFPDGMCLDASGALWIALAAVGVFVRMAEGGKLLEVIKATEGFKATACVLGGPDGKTLFMLETRETKEEAVKANGPGNSRIVAAQVDVPGASAPDNPEYFAGYC